jgi:hypothetical protein
LLRARQLARCASKVAQVQVFGCSFVVAGFEHSPERLRATVRRAAIEFIGGNDDFICGVVVLGVDRQAVEQQRQEKPSENLCLLHGDQVST